MRTLTLLLSLLVAACAAPQKNPHTQAKIACKPSTKSVRKTAATPSWEVSPEKWDQFTDHCQDEIVAVKVVGAPSPLVGQYWQVEVSDGHDTHLAEFDSETSSWPQAGDDVLVKNHEEVVAVLQSPRDDGNKGYFIGKASGSLALVENADGRKVLKRFSPERAWVLEHKPN